MRVLVDLVDTGQVQFFRPIIERLLADGHQVKVTARDKDLTLFLLEKYNIPHECISQMGHGKLGLAKELFFRDIKLFRIARYFHPDVILAQTGVSATRIGAVLRIPTIVLEEAEHAKLQRMISLPFASRIMTGTGYLHDHGKKQRRFRGIWVQSYLKPDYFTPQKEPLIKAGIDPDKPYIVLRTVAWEAAHDIGYDGVSVPELEETVRRLQQYGRVIISAEKPLPDSLKTYANPLAPEEVLHLLSFATLYIGEGGTMAAEAAVMGIPAIFCNPLRCGYLLALEKDYDLLYNVPCLKEGLSIAERLLKTDNLKEQWKQKSRRLWEQTDDITDYMIDLVDEVTGLRRL